MVNRRIQGLDTYFLCHNLSIVIRVDGLQLACLLPPVIPCSELSAYFSAQFPRLLCFPSRARQFSHSTLIPHPRLVNFIYRYNVCRIMATTAQVRQATSFFFLFHLTVSQRMGCIMLRPDDGRKPRGRPGRTPPGNF